MTACGICLEKRTSTITCPKCEFVSCSVCIKKYFETQSEPVCPNTDCRMQFTREIISNALPSLLAVFKKMREKFLLDLEKSRLPAAQVYTEICGIHKNFENVVDALERRRRELTLEATRIERQLNAHYIIQEYIRLNQYQEALTHHNTYFQTGEAGPSPTKIEKVIRTTVYRCPDEKCRGFVCVKRDDSQRGQCGVCNTEVCIACSSRVEDGVNHECNQDDVASTKELRKNSKQCPKCSIPISKIDGCDQMWCVMCHTAFSWKTGEIVKGVIHNPHFFAYQRQLANGREIPRIDGVENCGNNFFHNERGIPAWFAWYVSGDTEEGAYMSAFCRLSRHFSEYDHRIITRRHEPDNLDLRVRFLLGKIEDGEFGKIVQQRDKKYQKELDVDAVMLILFDSGNRLIESLTSGTIFSTYTQLKNLVDLSNTRLEEISKIYKNKTKKIVYAYDKVSKVKTMRIE